MSHRVHLASKMQGRPRIVCNNSSSVVKTSRTLDSRTLSSHPVHSPLRRLSHTTDAVGHKLDPAGGAVTVTVNTVSWPVFQHRPLVMNGRHVQSAESSWTNAAKAVSSCTNTVTGDGSAINAGSTQILGLLFSVDASHGRYQHN